jgi:hypothetical protein
MGISQADWIGHLLHQRKGIDMTEQVERQKIHHKTVELSYMMNSSDNPLMTAAVLVESLIALIEQAKDEHLLSCVVSYLNEWLATKTPVLGSNEQIFGVNGQILGPDQSD